MKTGSWAKSLVAAALVLAAAAIPGCSGFWDPLPGTGTSTTTASGNFYVINQTTPQVSGFAFAASATAPTAISGGSVSLSSAPLAVAIDPTGSFVYVSTATGIYLFTVGTGGALTEANSNQPISTDPAYAMQVDPSGAWLLEVVSGVSSLTAIGLDSSTGLYNSSTGTQTTALPASTVQQIAVSPSSATAPYVFVAMGTGGTAVIPFNTANSNPLGKAVTIAPKNKLGGDNAVATDPTGVLLYVGETAALSTTQSGGLRVFTIGSTAITEISGSPFSTGGTGPSSIVTNSTAVYVANSAVSGSSDGNISGFTVTTTGTTPTLTAINTVSAGVQTSSIIIDSTGVYLLAVNHGGSPDLSSFTFDSTTAGKLDAGPTGSTGTDPTGAWQIVAVP